VKAIIVVLAILLVIGLAVVLVVSTDERPASVETPAAVEEGPSVEADMEALDRLRVAALEALRSADEDALYDCFTDDAVVMDPGASSAYERNGHDHRFLSVIFLFGAVDAALTPHETTVSGDWAFEWGSHRKTMLEDITVESDTEARYEGDYVAILRRQPDGEWKIARFIYTEPIG